MRNPPTLSFALHHHGEGLPHVVVHDIAEQEKKESFSLPTHDESMRTSNPWRNRAHVETPFPPTPVLAHFECALSLARPVVHEGGKPRTASPSSLLHCTPRARRSSCREPLQRQTTNGRVVVPCSLFKKALLLVDLLFKQLPRNNYPTVCSLPLGRQNGLKTGSAKCF